MAKNKTPDLQESQLLQALTQLVATYAAQQGRKGDNALVHVDTGEVILPRDVVENNQAVIAALLTSGGYNPTRYLVGHKHNSVNPTTGLLEFWGADASEGGTAAAGAAAESAAADSFGGSSNDGGGWGGYGGIESVSFDTAVANSLADMAAGTPGFGTGPAGPGTGHSESGNMGAYGAGFGSGGVGYDEGTGAIGRGFAQAMDIANRAAAGKLTANEAMRGVGALLGTGISLAGGINPISLGMLGVAALQAMGIDPTGGPLSALGDKEGVGTEARSPGTDNQSDSGNAQLPRNNTSQPTAAAAAALENALAATPNSNNAFRIQEGAPEWSRQASQDLERAIAEILNTQPKQRRAFSRLPLVAGLGERAI